MAVNFALSTARLHAKAMHRQPQRELKAAAKIWTATHKERRENELTRLGVVIPLSEWLGHNNGPDLFESTAFLEFIWTRAQADAFRPPSLEIGRRWADAAEKLGLTYREYRLELLEHGRHPTEEDATRIRANRPRPAGDQPVARI